MVSVVAALAAVIAAVGVWRDRPEPLPIQPVALAPAPAANPGAGTADGPSITALGSPVLISGGAVGSAPTGRTAPPHESSAVDLVVSVTGLVRRPGLVRLPAGARVADAVQAAGGVGDGGDLTGLNLAAKLLDGASVVVGPAGRSALAVPDPVGGAVGPTGTGPALVNINAADEAALQALPGVGPVTAATIVAWRSAHGAFASVDELQAIPGIGPAKFAQIAPRVTT